MASFKNTLTSLVHYSRTLHFYFPLTQNHIILFSFLIFSIFLFSASFTNHPDSVNASSFYSRFLFTTSTPSFSSISSSNTCLVSDLETNCTLSSLTTVQRIDNADDCELTKRGNFSSCDLFSGNWVLDDHDDKPLYDIDSCPFVDDTFNCFKNGRPDREYVRYKWRPFGCENEFPRFSGGGMLDLLRGKRLVFVGDSLNRNMWNSLVCALRESLKNKSRIFEVSGRQDFKTQGFYSFKFPDYKLSIDFVKSPFLVQEVISDRGGIRRETLRLDMIQKSSSKYRNADMIIFNTGHWWNHQKTYKGNNYFQEGSHVYNRLDVTEAYTKALSTWAKWVDSNIHSNRTRVFFLGYSASHFRKGQWSTGGRCDGDTQPITIDAQLAAYPWMMKILESMITEMKTPVVYLNITKMTDYREDGHPSIYRKPQIRRIPGMMIQDCSHWCLPGVPDSWNELLYATLLQLGPPTTASD